MSSLYGRLNRSEMSLLAGGFLLSPAGTAYIGHSVDKYAKQALSEASRRFPAGELHNGRGDAFRHAYWNALMTRHLTSFFAELFATAHEDSPGQPAAERAMDLHNNAEGRRIGMVNPGATDAQLAALVMTALQQGRLVTLR